MFSLSWTILVRTEVSVRAALLATSRKATWSLPSPLTICRQISRQLWDATGLGWASWATYPASKTISQAWALSVPASLVPIISRLCSHLSPILRANWRHMCHRESAFWTISINNKLRSLRAQPPSTSDPSIGSVTKVRLKLLYQSNQGNSHPCQPPNSRQWSVTGKQHKPNHQNVWTKLGP
jgi:hypothetical protein